MLYDRSYLRYASLRTTEGANGSYFQDAVMSANMEKIFNYYEAYEELPTNLDCYTLPVYIWEGQGETGWCKDTMGEHNQTSNLGIFTQIRTDAFCYAAGPKVLELTLSFDRQMVARNAPTLHSHT